MDTALQTMLDRIEALHEELVRRLDRLEERVSRLRRQSMHADLASLLRSIDPDSKDLALHELSVFSQNGEDGVILEVLRRIGRLQGEFVEIGVHSAEANCLLLADVLGWSGVFIDQNIANLSRLKTRYRNTPSIRVLRRHVTAENVASLLQEANVGREFDLLSIDVDGNDYWVWKAITDWEPAVVVIEYNSSIDPGASLVQPYEPDAAWDETDFFGASLAALRALGSRKGYTLVYAELTGTNLFFVRSDVIEDRFSADPVVVRTPNYYLESRVHRQHGGTKEFIEPEP
jgi:hypothetical protein